MLDPEKLASEKRCPTNSATKRTLLGKCSYVAMITVIESLAHLMTVTMSGRVIVRLGPLKGIASTYFWF
jgi:hypothetical protein